jgi:hypothetical protein
MVEEENSEHTHKNRIQAYDMAISDAEIIANEQRCRELANSATEQKIEQICRLIYTATESVTDSEWDRMWEWYNDPYNTARGGPWSVRVAAGKIMNLLQSPPPAKS